MTALSKFTATFEYGEPVTIEAYSWRIALEKILLILHDSYDLEGLVSITVED